MRAKRVSLAVGSVVIATLVGCGSPPPADSPEQPEAESTAVPSATAEPAPAEEAAPPPAEPAAETEAQPKPDVPPYGSSLDRIMQAHFNDALLIRAAVISGKPEEASKPATVIANVQELDKLPQGWRPFVEEMQQAATRVTNSTTPGATAAAAVDLGVTCGNCHQQIGGPKRTFDPQPAPGDTVESRMKVHGWATDRLWDALALPSDEAWNAGAKALTTEPFPKEFLKQGGVDVRSAAADFGKLAAKASAKKTTPERAALYAELMVTCGVCHYAINNPQ